MLDNELQTLLSRDKPGFVSLCFLDSELVARLQAETATVHIYISILH